MIHHAADLVIGAAIVLVIFAALSGVRAAECGKASYYCCEHQGRTMANGRPFNQNAMTTAHMTAAFGTKLRVTYRGKSVVVRVNDRGAFAKYGRILDLSRGAFVVLAGSTGPGVIKICMERL